MNLDLKNESDINARGLSTFFLIEKHQKWVEEVYLRLPKKIRKLIERKYLIVNYAPNYFSDQTEAAYFIIPNLIEFNKRYFSFLMNKEFFVGVFVHELGHFCAHNLNPLFRYFYLQKYKKFSNYVHKLKTPFFRMWS